jgi:hypothetical protein
MHVNESGLGYQNLVLLSVQRRAIIYSVRRLSDDLACLLQCQNDVLLPIRRHLGEDPDFVHPGKERLVVRFT